MKNGDLNTAKANKEMFDKLVKKLKKNSDFHLNPIL